MLLRRLGKKVIPMALFAFTDRKRRISIDLQLLLRLDVKVNYSVIPFEECRND
jgi:hypothetical protein